MTIGVSLCAGTLAVELHQICRLGPLTGFMGSKRRWAGELGAAVYGDTKPERLIVVDAGPWGDVWKTLSDPTQRARVVERLLKLDAQGTLKDLWPELVAEAPSEDAARRVAQYLCVQSRVSNSLPVWWEPGEAEQPTAPLDVSIGGGRSSSAIPTIPQALDAGRGARESAPRPIAPLPVGTFVVPTKGYETAPYRRAAPQHSRASTPVLGGDEGEAVPMLSGWTMPESKTDIKLKGARPKAPGSGDGGMRRVATLAERIQRIPPEVYARLHVVHGKVQDVPPIPGAVVLFDPPYRGAPRYAEVLPREEVLDVARIWAKVAARVVVCEGEPLPLDGWATWRLAAKEWVTAWGVPHAPGAQLRLVPDVYRSDRKR